MSDQINLTEFRSNCSKSVLLFYLIGPNQRNSRNSTICPKEQLKWNYLLGNTQNHLGIFGTHDQEVQRGAAARGMEMQ